MRTLHDTIKCERPDRDSPIWFESVPDAVAECRRYFMGGGRESCRVHQDSLVYTIDVKPDWNGKGLP